VIVANAREVPLIYKSRRKNDKLDAEKLARLARLDPKLLKGIRHRGAEGQGDLLLIRSRAQVVETRTGLMNMVRGLVKSRGERLPLCTSEGFVVELLEGVDEAAVRALKPVMILIEQMTETIQGYDQQVEEMGKKHAENRQAGSGIGSGATDRGDVHIDDRRSGALWEEPGCGRVFGAGARTIRLWGKPTAEADHQGGGRVLAIPAGARSALHPGIARTGYGPAAVGIEAGEQWRGSREEASGGGGGAEAGDPAAGAVEDGSEIRAVAE
jgi:hypothetical protein